MAATDRVSIEIYVDDQGSVQIRNVKKELDGMGSSAEKCGQSLNRYEDASVSSATATGAIAAEAGKAIAALVALSGVYYSLKSAIDVGARVETLGIAMNVVGKNAGVSAQSLQYFTEQAKSAGITTAEAMGGITKFLSTGLDLSKLKELATRARDIGVIANLNTSEVFSRLIHGITSQQVEVIRALGVNIGTIDDAVKNYSRSLGKNKDEIDAVTKSNLTLNLVLDRTTNLAGAAAAADASVGKQLQSMARYADEAKLAFWDLFQPGMSAGVGAMTNVFKDLKKFADDNRLSLAQLGQDIGQVVAKITEIVLEIGKWIAKNSELLKTLIELYAISKIIAVITALGQAIYTLYGVFTTVTAAALASEAAIVGYGLAASGALVPIQSLTAGLGGLRVAFAGVAPFAATAAVLGAYGAYKTFTAPGDVTQAGGLGVLAAPDQPEVDSKLKNSIEEQKRIRQLVQTDQQISDLAMREAKKAVELESQKAQSKMIPKAGGGGGGGKGGDGGLQSSLDQMQRIINGLQKDLSRLTEGSLAEIDAWEKAQLDSIAKVARKGADAAEAEALVAQVKNAKIEKLDDEYFKWFAGQTEDKFAAIDAEEATALKKYQGFAEREAEIKKIYADKRRIQELDDQNADLALYSGYLSKISSLTATSLSGRLTFERRSIQMDDQKEKNAIDLLYLHNKITDEQKEQLLVMQNLVTEGRLYENALKGSGWAGGVQAGILQRSQRDSAYESGTQFFGELEKGAVDVGKQIAHGFIEGKKMDIAQLGLSMAETFVDRLIESRISAFFDTLAKAFANTIAGALSSGSGAGGAGGGFFGKIFGGLFGGGGYSANVQSTGYGLIDSMLGGMSMRYHGGGVVQPIYAHGGLNLAPDEVPIIAQTGERVLSRAQNRDYEAGAQVTIIVQNNTNTQVQATGKRVSDKEFLIMLDEANARLLSSGGKMTSVLNQKFGVQPNTTRR